MADADSEHPDLVVLPVVPSIVLHHAAGVTRRAARSARKLSKKVPPAIQTSRPGRLHGLKWGPIYDTFKVIFSLSMCENRRNGIWDSFMPCEMSSFGTLIAPVGDLDC